MKLASTKQYIPLQTAMLRNFQSFLDLRAERLKSKLIYKPRVCKNHTFHAALIHKAYVWGVTTGNTENVIPISFTPREFQLPIIVYNWMTEKLTRKITIYQSQQKSQNCDVEPQTAIPQNSQKIRRFLVRSTDPCACWDLERNYSKSALEFMNPQRKAANNLQQSCKVFLSLDSDSWFNLGFHFAIQYLKNWAFLSKI